MRAYYYDNKDGLPNDSHDSGRLVDPNVLKNMGVLYWSIPVDSEGKWEAEIDNVAEERGYKNRDVIEPSRATLAEKYDSTVAMFWKE
jgi:1,2-dihydroxy-3-keto-5-methylthiopentene dioxygenase